MQITYNSAVLTEKDPVVQRVTGSVTAPVLCDFIGWVLKSAQEKGIKRLYFLARDGMIMHGIAGKIKEKLSLDLELRYLYCSRMSLRNAALEQMGEEKYRYLLEGGFALTPSVILGRLRLDSEQRRQVYSDIAFEGDEETELGKTAAADFCGRLRNSNVYNGFVKAVSQKCSETALAYLEQQGLMSDIPYAVVDSGWTGSMQKMLRILTGKRQIGYYFGLYKRPDIADGEFYPYLFDASTSARTVSRFNNHLFEALCSAPHGMTVGYEIKDGIAQPVFNAEKSLNAGSGLLQIQQQEICRYIAEEYQPIKAVSDMKARQSFAFPLLDRLMFKPDAEIAEKYGGLLFSDDPAELYSFPLAASIDDTKRLYLLPRLREKYFRRDKLIRPIYWGYATAVLSGKARFCRMNLRAWEILWLLKSRRS